MLSLAFGLVAALAWGLHDFCVRFVGQRGDPAVLFLAVLVFGCIWFAPLTMVAGGWPDLTPRGAGYAVLSGLAYVVGGLGLYRAFAIGPVRLVAPITGSFPILSVAWAAVQGQPVSALQWAAVLAVLGGIAAVAVMGSDEDMAAADAASDRRWAAIGWAAAASVGFALTFATGQIAGEASAGLAVIVIARIVSVLGILAVSLASRIPLRLHRAHLPLLAGMGLLDVAAMSLVIAAGSLAHPEYAVVASSVFGVVTILLAWRFLREPMTPGQWAGVAVVFAGIGYLAL